MAKAGKFQEDKSLNKPRAFVISARVLLVGENIPNRRAVPLSVSNGLLAADFRLSDCDAQKVQHIFHLDRCASMNTGNLLFHQWLVKKYPTIVNSYEHFDDANPFRFIILSRTLDTDDTEKFESGNLIAVVTCKTCYSKVDGTLVKVSFVLGYSIAVNAIVGLSL